MKIDKRRPAFEYKLINDTKDIFSSIFNATPVALILLSWPAKKILRFNGAALSLFKIKSVEGLSKNQRLLLEQFKEADFKGKEYFETEIKTKNSRGSFVFLIAKVRKVEDSQVILTLEDITPHKVKEKKLLKLSQLDGLTGILNHKTVMNRFKEELARAKRYHLPLSCFMFDVDDFKVINDKLGHLQGDHLLRKIAQTLKGHIRETDIIGRYGGDEFLVVMPNTPLSDVWVPAKRIHSFFSKTPLLKGAKAAKIKNTFSIGISGFPIKGLETVKDIINHADKGLYQAKVKGGNLIIHWGA